MPLELETVNKLYLELSSHVVTATTGRELALHAALKEANEMCRSALEIAHRKGEATNWDAFRKNLKIALKNQHRILAQKLPHE